jgi:transcriptional regulator with XRE-family HTH domain
MAEAVEDMRRLVGRNVARLRRARGLTQEQMAERSGFSQQYLSGLERGRRNPTVVTLHELARALGVGPRELLAPAPDEGAAEDGGGDAGRGGRAPA